MGETKHEKDKEERVFHRDSVTDDTYEEVRRNLLVNTLPYWRHGCRRTHFGLLHIRRANVKQALSTEGKTDLNCDLDPRVTNYMALYWILCPKGRSTQIRTHLP